jgi:hypothetical protein
MSAQGQSKRRLPPGSGIRLFTAALFAIAGPGLGVYAFIAAQDAVSDSAATWTRAAGVVLGGFFLFAAYILARTVFPPKARHLKVTLSAPQARRGGPVDARLEVMRAGDDPIELGLVCTEYYDVEKTQYNSNSGSSTYRDTDQAVAFEDWRPVTGGGSVHNVRFEIPAEAPFSFRGDCLSFEWRVSARQPKKMRFDRAVNVDLQVLP